MKPRYFPIVGSLFAFTAAGTLLIPQAAPAQEAGAVEANEDVEVLTRGPVHEAFAESVSFEAEAGFTISSAPPELIEELPPDQQPEGENVTWIPGYWAWDDDQNDFLWISGVWRNIPPGRQWVPGYWNDLGNGSFQWISGYWADTTTEEVEYVEAAPPKNIDAGPNIAAPSEDHTWVPGNWMWSTTRYVWRPGYWLALRPNWTWVPSRYCWSPRGYVYVDGYWDYAVVNRGVLFAPVHFRRHVWNTPGYYYTPSLVVSLNVFSDHLFIRPRCRHYYFGDYYAPRYRDSGFYASFHWHRHHHRGYDPIYAYQRWNHRHDRQWERRHEDNYNYFRDNDRFRPPHTWAVMRGLRGEKFDDDRNRSRLFVNSLDGVVKSPERGMKFRPVDKDRRERIVAQRQDMRAFTRQRRDLEAKAVAVSPAGDAGGKKVSVREKLRRSPVMGRQAEQFAKNEAPPKRPEPRGNAMRPGRAGKDAMPAKPTEPGTPEVTGRGKRGTTPETQVRPGRQNTPKERTREMPDKTVDPSVDRKTTPKERTRETPQRKPQVTPQRKVQPEPQTRETPQRKPQVTPQRKVQPQPQTRETPKRQVTPERKVQPQPREAPKRQVQPQPRERQVQPQQRQVQPQQRQVQPRQPQVKPERKPQPKEQARQVPQRRTEPSAQRVAQPKPQARPQPQQRQVQPRQPQARPQPQQRQVQPRQPQVRPQPQQRQVQPRQPQQPQRQNREDRRNAKERA